MLVEGQSHWSMEQDKDSRNRLTNTLGWFLTKAQKQFDGELMSVSTNGAIGQP